MRDRLILILLLFAAALNGQDIGGDYYVAHPDSTYSGMNTASDSNDGSYANPWATLQHAFTVADKLDTVYIRGGRWMQEEELRYAPYDSAHNDGGVDSLIYYLNYPNETPIFDFLNIVVGNGVNQYWKTGFHLQRCNYMYFRGFEITNVTQDTNYITCLGINAYGLSNLTFENVNVNHIGGKGWNFISQFQYEEFPEQNSFPGDTQRFINCDASYCMDSLSMQPGAEADIGNYSDGFWINETGTVSHVIFQGCRAFMNSDDGFDIPTACLTTWINCWTFDNGHLLRGIGQGLRMSTAEQTADTIARVFNCISARNLNIGFHEGHEGSGFFGVECYNNFSYLNTQWGFEISGNRDPGPAEDNNNYINNIAYSNHTDYDVGISTGGFIYFHTNNAWTSSRAYNFDGVHAEPLPDISPAITITAEDFVSLDVDELYTARQADGSLPIVEFGHLAEGSDMIDAGYDVGLPYNGSAPDLGPFEYGEEEVPPTPARTTRPMTGNGVIQISNGRILINE